MALSTSIRHLRLLSTSSAAASTISISSAAASTISISSAKSKLRSEQAPDKALEIHSSSPVASRHVHDLTIRRLSKSRRFSDIEYLIESQKKDAKIKEEPFLSTLIRSYGRAGMFDHALNTFNQMEELGTPRSAISFNALLSACNYTKKFDQVPKLFSEIPQKYKLLPDKISYGILIKSLCESGVPESAFLTMKEMQEKGVEITAVTYTTILDSLYKKGKVEEAEKLWKTMVESGCEPDVTAYNVKIMHASEGKPEDVLGIFDQMKDVGLKQDTVSYNYLMTCYCKNGMLEDADKVYKSLEENGCSPNAATFRTFVYYLTQSGDLDHALRVFKDSVNDDKVPSFGTLNGLVKRLVKESRVEEAKNVIRTVKKKFPQNTLSAWKKLENELGLSKEDKEYEVKEAAA